MPWPKKPYVEVPPEPVIKYTALPRKYLKAFFQGPYWLFRVGALVVGTVFVADIAVLLDCYVFRPHKYETWEQMTRNMPESNLIEDTKKDWQALKRAVKTEYEGSSILPSAFKRD